MPFLDPTKLETMESGSGHQMSGVKISINDFVEEWCIVIATLKSHTGESLVSLQSAAVLEARALELESHKVDHLLFEVINNRHVHNSNIAYSFNFQVSISGIDNHLKEILSMDS